MGIHTSQQRPRWNIIILTFIVLRTLFALLCDVKEVSAQITCFMFANNVYDSFGAKSIGQALCQPNSTHDKAKYATVGDEPESFIILDMGDGNEIIDGPGTDFYYYERPLAPGIQLDQVTVSVAVEDNGLEDPATFINVFIWGDEDPNNNGEIPLFYLPEDANKPINSSDLYGGTGIGVNIGNDDYVAYRYVRFQTYPTNIAPANDRLVEVDAVERIHTPPPPTLTSTPLPMITPTYSLTPMPTETLLNVPAPTDTPNVTSTYPSTTEITPTESEVPAATDTLTNEMIETFTPSHTSTNIVSAIDTLTPTSLSTNAATHTSTTTFTKTLTMTSTPTFTYAITLSLTSIRTPRPTRTPTKIEFPYTLVTAGNTFTPSNTKTLSKPLTFTFTKTPTVTNTQILTEAYATTITLTPTIASVPTNAPAPSSFDILKDLWSYIVELWKSSIEWSKLFIVGLSDPQASSDAIVGAVVTGLLTWTGFVVRGSYKKPSNRLTKPIPSKIININSANKKTLKLLPNIGSELAQKIVDYRTINGPFTTVDDLLMVPGIGSATLDILRSKIKV